MCLSVQEFVPHPGYFHINLADKPVGPNDPEPAWVVLMDDTPQTTDGLTTATQRFSVTIPFGTASSNHSTIQVKQWSDEFQWYYYACTDIRIVSNPTDAGSGMCSDRGGEGGQCSRSDGPSRLRMGILEPVTYGLWRIATVVALAIWSVVVCKHGGAKRARRTAAASSSEETEAAKQCAARFRADASEFKRSLIAIAAISILALVIAVSLLQSWKAC